MILLKMCLFSAIMLSGYQHPENKKIQVTGTALNAKGGAVVIGTDQIPYYVDGLGSWGKELYGKKVKVSGILVIEKSPKNNQPKLQVAEIPGAKRTIKKPKWELIE